MNQNQNRRPFNPTTKALQFRAWQIAQREGGNVTREQIATEMGECPRRIGRVLRDAREAVKVVEKKVSALVASMAALKSRVDKVA